MYIYVCSYTYTFFFHCDGGVTAFVTSTVEYLSLNLIHQNLLKIMWEKIRVIEEGRRDKKGLHCKVLGPY